MWSRDGSVGIAARCGLGVSVFESWWVQEIFSTLVQTGYGAHSAICTLCVGAPSRVKAAGASC